MPTSTTGSLRTTLTQIQRLSQRLQLSLDPLLLLSSDQQIARALLQPKILHDLNRLTNLYDILGSSIDQVLEQLDDSTPDA